MRRAFRSESGQVLPFAVVMVLAFCFLMFFVMGAAVAEGIHTRLQAAADAAALAASKQAQLWEKITVQRHRFACFATKTGWDCSDTWAGPVTVTDGYNNLWPDGWVSEAGCQYTSDGQATVPPFPNPATVCDTWQLDQAGYDFPAGTDPTAAAQAYLAANVSRLEANGVSVQAPSVQISSASGAVRVTVDAQEPGNPLDMLLGHPVRIHVVGGARPRTIGQLQESGP